MKSGAGQAIDVSEQECIAAALELSLVWYTYEGKRTSRVGFVNSSPTGIFEFADGLAELMCVEQAQWERFVAFLGNPQWSREEIFQERQSRIQQAEALRPLVQDSVKDLRMLDTVRGLQDVRVPAAPVSTMAELYNDEHLKYREFFTALPARERQEKPVLAPGAPFKSTTMGWSMRRPAPLLGEHEREITAEIAARRSTSTLAADTVSATAIGPAWRSACPGL